MYIWKVHKNNRCSNPFAMCEHQTFSQIKVTFSFQFQQVDPTRCLQKSPLFRFLQLWNSLQLLGLASPVHILKKWFPGPLRTIFITMVPFLISQNLFGPLKSVQSRSEGHPSDGAPLPNGFRPFPNPRHWRYVVNCCLILSIFCQSEQIFF